MIDFDFEMWCCGCTSCASACPTGAITMQSSDEGFLMPVVDEGKCINCSKCDKVCSHLNNSENLSSFSLDSFKGKPSYLFFSNRNERIYSASGGFVYEAMRQSLSEGGQACGCVWNQDMKAVHIVSEKSEDVRRMQGSKYVQSDVSGIYLQVKDSLKAGRKVVFCGTPCQTAGLKQYLGKTEAGSLTSICLICHGVASPLAWEKWKTVMEKKYGGKLVDVNMRDKSYKGYATSYCKYTFESAPRTQGKKSGRVSHECGNEENTYLAERSTRNVGMPTYLADPYIFLFTDDLYLRRSCNRCQYKVNQNGADIIVGDFYESTPSAGNMGCSCVMAMTEKGDKFIKSIDGTLIESDFRTIGVVNSMLWQSVGENPHRKEFFEKLKTTVDGDASLFTSFLPLRFRVKKVLNQIGLFDFYLKLKRKWMRMMK